MPVWKFTHWFCAISKLQEVLGGNLLEGKYIMILCKILEGYSSHAGIHSESKFLYVIWLGSACDMYGIRILYFRIGLHLDLDLLIYCTVQYKTSYSVVLTPDSLICTYIMINEKLRKQQKLKIINGRPVLGNIFQLSYFLFFYFAPNGEPLEPMFLVFFLNLEVLLEPRSWPTGRMHMHWICIIAYCTCIFCIGYMLEWLVIHKFLYSIHLCIALENIYLRLFSSIH